LEQFNKYAGLKFDVKLASADALDAVKAKTGRICPLVCENGFRAKGDTCEKVICRAGYVVGDGDRCERRPQAKPVAKQAEPGQNAETAKPETAAAASGQVICFSHGCRPVRPGCRLVTMGWRTGNPSQEVCN
jgi:hypothetical protein